MTGDPVLDHLDHMRMRALSPVTIGARLNVLARVAAHIAPVPLLDASAGDLAGWRASLGQKPGTVAGYVSHVQGYYRWALGEGLISTDPSAHLPVPRIPKRLPRPIGEAALMEALGSAPRRVRPWLVLAGWCGLRACEIAGLRAENIRLRDVPPVVLITVEATKGRTERAVPLSAFVVAELEAARLPARGLAFTKMDGDPLPPWLVSKLGTRALRDVGASDTLHSLRHRFGTSVYRQSKDLLLTGSLLGHQHPGSTAIYALYDRAGAAPAVGSLPVPPPDVNPPDRIRSAEPPAPPVDQQEPDPPDRIRSPVTSARKVPAARPVLRLVRDARPPATPCPRTGPVHDDGRCGCTCPDCGAEMWAEPSS